MTIKELLEYYKDDFVEINCYYADSDHAEKLRTNLSNFLDSDEIDDEVSAEVAGCKTENEILEKMYIREYTKVLNYDLLDKEEYEAVFPGIEVDGKVLMVALERGIVPENKVWEDVRRGIIDENILSEVCFFFSKKAKEYRHFSNFQAKENKENYYWQKEKILDMFEPKELHFDEAYGILYSFYEFGSHSFHIPVTRLCSSIDEAIEELKESGREKEATLPVKILKAFESDNCSVDEMYCESFCEIVMEHLSQHQKISLKQCRQAVCTREKV